MNTKDLKDIGEAIYYLAAVEADLEGLGINAEFRGPEDVRVQMIKNLKQACTAIDRVALGTNRKAARKVGAA